MNQIKRWDNGKVICEGTESIKELAEKSRADLSRTDLSRTDLSRANLSRADLSRAYLSRANLSGADLSRANLSGADLLGAYLLGTDLSRADLSGADLSGAYLSGTDLSGTDLSGAYLFGTKNIEFYLLPSLATLVKIFLSNLPDNLQLELMRRDAQAHPNPQLFNEWVKTGKCPYQNEERFWLFEPKRKLWKPGKPQMNDFDLIISICKSQGWKIRNYLK